MLSAAAAATSLSTAWPPNWLRSAAIIFICGESSWREANRANSDAVIAGSGTALSIAASTVQRPSPESGAKPRSFSRCSSSSSALTARSSSQERMTVPSCQERKTSRTSVTESTFSSSSQPSA